MGTSTAFFSNLYYKKTKTHSCYVWKDGIERDLTTAVKDKDYVTETKPIVQLHNVVLLPAAEEFMQNLHSISGCAGRDKMRFALKSLKLCLDGKKSDLIDKFKSCEACRDKRTHYEVPPLVSSYPLERIVIDFTFMRSVNDDSLVTVFSAIDHFT